jgi:hypothetical protein
MYILLYTTQDLKSVVAYLQCTQIGTRKWLTPIENADIEDDEVTRRHRTDIGWERINEEYNIDDDN